MNKTLGKIHVGKTSNRKESSIGSLIKEYNPINNISIHKLYTIDLDISAEWIVSSLEGRIFLCDSEGEIRIFSYSRRLRRQPLLTERFHITTTRLITSFTVTHDYLIAFETDIQMLTLHTHHGALLIRLPFPYDPIMIHHCDYFSKKNHIWLCSRTKRQCFHFHLNHLNKDINPLEQLDFKHPISNISVDPVGISIDEQERIGIHDVNMTTSDRLLIFTDHQNMIIPLDLIKYADRQITSRIERVLLVPNQSNLIVLVYAPQSSTNVHEIVVVDIELQPAQILYRLTEPNGIKNIDLTLNGEMVYSVTTPANKRMTPKMQIYSLIP